VKTILNRVTHHATMGLFLLVITFCIVLSYRLVTIEFCLASIVFNLFFTSLFFQLNGAFKLKVAILTIGNVIGLFWNLLFQNLAFNGRLIFGDTFNVVFSITYPIFTLMWMVPFWSLSLSFLPKLQNIKENLAVKA
jgi:hypothetical protein